MSNPMNYWDSYPGTSWRGASGDVATVERQEAGLVLGTWESGISWVEHVDQLGKLYTPAPAEPEQGAA